MSAYAMPARTPRMRGGLARPGVAVLVAGFVGATAAVNGRMAIVLCIAVLLVAAVALRPSAVLLLLMSTIFIELANIGGVSISRLVAPIALLVVLLGATRPGTEIRASPPLFFAAAYAGWALASGMWSESTAGTMFLLLSLSISLVFMVAFASLLTSREELERVILVVAIASAVTGVMSVFAFIGHPILGVGVLQEGRVQGGTGDPSYFAIAQLIALPLVLAASGEVSGMRRNFYYLVALINVGSVLATVSRGGVLQLFVIAIILLLIPGRSVFGSSSQKTVVMVFLLLGGAVFMTHYSADIVPRLTTVFLPKEEQTGSGRTEIWTAARQAAAENRLTGIGYGAWVKVSNDRLVNTPNVDLSRWKLRPTGSEVHNTFLGTATELGVIGLTLFLGMLTSVILTLRRTARRALAAGLTYYAKVANALVIALIGWCIGSFFIQTETGRPLWILVGLTLALPKLVDSEIGRVVWPRAPGRTA